MCEIGGILEKIFALFTTVGSELKRLKQIETNTVYIVGA